MPEGPYTIPFGEASITRDGKHCTIVTYGLMVHRSLEAATKLAKEGSILVKDGFKVMVYCSDDPIQAKRLEELGCVAIMPLASLIGSGMGILNPWNLRLIIDNAKVPVIVDAGVGTASDATIGMELGCAGVLMNTAIASAKNPPLMAKAMKNAVQAGRDAFIAGRMLKKPYRGDPSSPTEGIIDSSNHSLLNSH